MLPPRAPQRATTRAFDPSELDRRIIKKLTRVTHGERTLYFTFSQKTGSGRRSATAFVKPENMPPFDGSEGWFEMVSVKAKPWPYWRAVRQVEPPTDAGA